MNTRITSNQLGRFLIFRDEHIVAETFHGEKIVGFEARGAHFEHCDFSGMRVLNASLGEGDGEISRYVDCVFDGLHVDRILDGNAILTQCSFRDVSIKRWIATETQMVDCVFTGKIRDANILGTVPSHRAEALGRTHNLIVNNDFTEADLSSVAFLCGVDLSRQRLPVGEGYIYISQGARAVAAAREASGTFVGREKDDFEVAISMVERLLEEGQEQIFLRLDDYRHYGTAMSRLAALMLAADERDSEPHGR
jgi:hypothetical protein